MQLRIFNLFGGGHTEISIALIVVGAVLWVVGAASRGSVPFSAQPAPPLVGRGATPAVTSVPNVAICSKCGARTNPADQFCMECGNPLPQAAAQPALPAAGAIAPKRRTNAGCLIFLVFLLLLAGGTAWFFFGPSKPYSPPARSEPGVPRQMAGTLTEFPIDPASSQQMQPTTVVSHNFEPAGQSGAPAQGIQAPAETFPPGLNTSIIPQTASTMTSCTYRIDPQSVPVQVHVLQVGLNISIASWTASG